MSDHWIQPFLRALERTGVPAAAAREVGIPSAKAYARRKSDADFAEACDAAVRDCGEMLLAEAHRRAMGYEELVVHKGELTPVWAEDADGQYVMDADNSPVQKRDANGKRVWLTITKGSDQLLIRSLMATHPAWRTERTELTGADGGPLDVRSMDRVSRSARVAALMALAEAREGLARAEKEFGDLA